MNIKIQILLLWLITLYTYSCTSPRISLYDSNSFYKKLSCELECSNTNQTSAFQKKEIVQATNSLSKTNRVLPLQERKVRKTVTDTSIQKKNDSSIKSAKLTHNAKSGKANPIVVDKQNIFWKIGKVIFKVGLISFSIFGGVFLSVSNYGVGIYLGGLIISLAILAISGIFFLFAIIDTKMKELSKPIENPNEI